MQTINEDKLRELTDRRAALVLFFIIGYMTQQWTPAQADAINREIDFQAELEGRK